MAEKRHLLLPLLFCGLICCSFFCTANGVTDEQFANLTSYTTQQANVINFLSQRVENLNIILENLQPELDNREHYVLWGAVLIFLMQAGLVFYEAGSVRAAHVTNIALKNLINVSIVAIVWWLFGFAFVYGVREKGGLLEGNGFIGSGSFVLVGDGPYPGAKNYSYGFWFFQFGLACLVVNIVSSAMSERTRLYAQILITFFVVGWIYPIPAHWVWGCPGWLSSRQRYSNCSFKYNLGRNGLIDFAGGGVVNMVAGFISLIGAWQVGHRQGAFDHKYGNHLSSLQFRPANRVFQVAGIFLLWVGWYGYTAASTFGYPPAVAGKSTTTVTLSAATAGLTSMFIGHIFSPDKYLNFNQVVNGWLAGLVSITAGCAVVEPWAAVVIGFIGALVYWGASKLVFRLDIDDPVDAFAVHGACGFWSILAAGIFATGSNIEQAYGTNTHAYGAILGGGIEQMGVQILGGLCMILWTLIFSFILIWLIKRFVGLREERATVAEVDKHSGPAFLYTHNRALRKIEVQGAGWGTSGTQELVHVPMQSVPAHMPAVGLGYNPPIQFDTSNVSVGYDQPSYAGAAVTYATEARNNNAHYSL